MRMANLSSYDQQSLFGTSLILTDFLESGDLCSVIQKEIAPLIKDSNFSFCKLL